ncbi:MAG: AAA family ATPase [Thermodesulfobacteriota bacterium]|nr:AAA family ATPase [Thermodesulfobacteriota bacterium]
MTNRAPVMTPKLEDTYTIVKKIAETHSSVIHQGLDNNNRAVAIKILKIKKPAEADIVRFREEYAIINALDTDHIVKTFAIGDFNGQPAVVMELIDADPLRAFMGTPVAIDWFLDIAIQLSETLCQLHKNKIVHKDIKPGNIFIQDNRVTIADYGIIPGFTCINENLFDIKIINGTLAYISPEQTGRIKRAVDYRTDLYSIGAIFYEMLTGRPPFVSEDPFEIIHSHLAVMPEPPKDVNPDVPPALSAIVTKLLNKAAEERYQSCFGLTADLKQCQRAIISQGTIPDFEPGAADAPLQFNIPHKLVGRERAINRMLSVFDSVSRGRTESLMVYGHPGIGKSALLNEIHKPMVARKSYFLSGKYDQFKKDIPYSALIQAFQGLIQQLLTESDDRTAAWKKKILDALGDNGKVITDVIPELTHIIGVPPDVPVLGAQAAQNRFMFVFKNFLKAFSAKEHPLVLSLDDLQWVDSASLHLLRSILTDKTVQYLFVILTFRNNEIDRNHLFYQILEDVRASGVPVSEIEVGPLSEEHTREFIGNCFALDDASLSYLSRIIYEKTNGNPFFIIQFIEALYEKKRVARGTDGNWTIDMDKIAQMAVTDNVIDLLTHKISELPETTQHVLKVCACIGSSFDLETVNRYAGLPLPTVLREIKTAVDEHFIYFQNNIYRFHHDRIQEAAYTLIPTEEKEHIHHRIGRTEHQQATEESLQENILYIVNQLNIGKRLLTTDEEKEQLISLNLMAGRKAINASAFEAAYTYLMTAVTLLTETSAGTGTDLFEAVYSEAALAAYLNSDFETMEQFTEQLIHQTDDIRKHLAVYEIKMRAFMAKGQKKEAVMTARSVFRQLKLNFPEYPRKYHLILSLIKVKSALAGKKVADLIHLPLMTDPDVQAKINMIGYYSPIAYWARPEAVPLIAFTGVYYTVKYGLSNMSPIMLAGYGIAMSSMGHYETAYNFGRLAQTIFERLESKSLAPRTRFIFLTWVKHWKDYQRDIPRRLLENHQKAMEVGDLEFAAHALMVHSYQSLYAGFPLQTVEQNILRHIETLIEMQQQSQLNLTRIYGQTVQNLLGKSEDPGRLKGDIYDEAEMLPLHEKAEDQFAIHSVHVFNLILGYLFGNFQKALDASAKYQQFLSASAKGVMTYAVWNFHDSLTRLAIARDANRKRREKLLRDVARNQKKMRHWATLNPANFMHKYLLVEAERDGIQGDLPAAIDGYQKAILKARENRYIQDEALGHELAARFWLANNNETYATPHLEQALSCYSQWGASAKILSIEKEHPDLIARLNKEKQHPAGSGLAVTTGETHQFVKTMDMNAVIKSAQALSGEIVLENLLKKIMKIAIEYAGAQRGIMIFERNGKYYVEVEMDADGNTDVLHAIPVEDYQKCAASVVSYTTRTRESIVLNNACEDERYFNDPYVKTNQTKSILCAPIQNKDKVAAILYLENNYIANVFVPERIEVLKTLSSQAAISIQNASLFKEVNEAKEEIQAHRDHLEEMVEERTRALKNAQQELIKNAHQAGMADIAVGVLHNVGNVLNSVKTSLESVKQTVNSAKGFKGFLRANELLEQHMDHIEDFVLKDPKGKKLFEYYLDIGRIFQADKNKINADLDRLEEKTDMITNIIAAQQSYANAGVLKERLDIADIIRDALTMQAESLSSQNITVTQNVEIVPAILVDKTKLIHVLINILRNARDAMNTTPMDQRNLKLSVRCRNDIVRVEATDNGQGIEPDHLKTIFAHGYTTKPDGHGFGLHTSANYMLEMGGRMWAESDGPGKGSTFVLEFPAVAS